MTVQTDPAPINDESFDVGLRVPEEMSCSEWADKYFILSSESSNTSGQWETTPVQKAILNSFGNDAIEKVDFIKSARFGGSKMAVIANAYQITHLKRNTCFYQPTKADSDRFVKNEIEPSLRDCEPWNALLVSKQEKSMQNTLSFKAFLGCSAFYKGGHSANSFRSLTLDTVILDELDAFNADVGREGSPSTLSWGRVKNSLFKKQIQISTPTITDLSLIQKSSKSAADIMEYHVECPHCSGHDPIHWGGTDLAYGFKWEDRDPSTVQHFCRLCGSGWDNGFLAQAVEAGYWQGVKGLKTYDGLEWFHNDEPCPPPRHIAWRVWSAYSPFSSWQQIVEEMVDAIGDPLKMQAFTNTTLGRTWDVDYGGTVTAEAIGEIIPTHELGDIKAVTCGIDTQSDRLEVQYVGFDANGNTYILGYSIHHGDTSQAAVYDQLATEVFAARFRCGSKELPVVVAAIDTQGCSTDTVHDFLSYHRNNRSGGIQFIGINGHGGMTSMVSDKTSYNGETKKKPFWSIGVNVLKAVVYNSIVNSDQEKGAFRIAADAALPADYAKQLVSEKMERRRIEGKDKIVFTIKSGVRNESLDTLAYAIAAKEWAKVHGSGVIKRYFAGL